MKIIKIFDSEIVHRKKNAKFGLKAVVYFRIFCVVVGFKCALWLCLTFIVAAHLLFGIVIALVCERVSLCVYLSVHFLLLHFYHRCCCHFGRVASVRALKCVRLIIHRSVYVFNVCCE